MMRIRFADGPHFVQDNGERQRLRVAMLPQSQQGHRR